MTIKEKLHDFIYKPAIPKRKLNISCELQKEIVVDMIDYIANSPGVYAFLCHSLEKALQQRISYNTTPKEYYILWKISISIMNKIGRATYNELYLKRWHCWRFWAFDEKESRLAWLREGLERYERSYKI